MHSLAISLLLFGFSLCATTDDDVIVNLMNGAVRGSTKKSSEGVEYFAFLGIPFAEPPVDELRFKAPVAKKPWQESGVFDATKDGSPCVQFDMITQKTIGSEDCLILNVYTKNYSDSASKKSVMVWIYGGGFFSGHASSWYYGPSRFLANDVVFVSLNYRLGSLGFLSTSDDASPGNYGLLDQLEALKWVKSNIEAFGGDSNKITLFGESAGSISLVYQLLSPLTEGLFQRAIALSGSATSQAGLRKNPQIWAEKLGKVFNCSQDHHELVNCLRKIPAYELITETNKLTSQAVFPFPPVIDGNFLSIEPKKAFEEGKFHKMPVIIGNVRDEGIGLLPMFHPGIQKYSEDFVKGCISQVLASEETPHVTTLLKHRYLENSNLSNPVEFTVAISKMFGDGIIEVACLDTARQLVNQGAETYLYKFEFAANYSFTSNLGISEFLGVGHLDDVWYLFDGEVFGPFMRNDKVKQISTKFVKLLTNFAKFGDATQNMDVKWPQSSQGNLLMYHINDEDYVTKYDIDSDSRIEFWLKTIPENMDKCENEKRKK